MKWRWLLVAPIIGWVSLVGTSRGLLIRYDPMFMNDSRVITDAACTYSSGLRTATVFVIGDPRGADCARLHKFGSISPCPSSF